MTENPAPETTKVACFGANSSGKTLQIRSLIEAYGAANVGIVSCEHGLGTIQSSLDGVGKREPGNLAEFKDAWKWAQDNYSGRDKWVCIDGGTRALQWGSNDILQGTDEAFIRLATGAGRHELPSPLRPWLRYITSDGNIDSRKQWMSIAWDADHEMNRWVKLPCNHYWTFWEDETWINEAKKGVPWTVDALGKGSRQAIYGTFDFILRLTREGSDGEMVVATHDPSGRIVKSKARDDWNWVKVPTRQEHFNLAKFVESLKPPSAAKET
jgi:hypothetical protein